MILRPRARLSKDSPVFSALGHYTGAFRFSGQRTGAVAIVSEARELAIPAIVVGEFAFGIAGPGHGPQYWN